MVASVLLLLLAPLLVLIALLIRLDSPGPVLFRQTRTGLNGRVFRIYKFRTMHVQEDGPEVRQACRMDPRVTCVGRILRRTHLDELPQLINVLRGEMSLVGPRPPLPCEVELYEDHHYTRLDMKPGITGPWQVGGRNNITDFEEVVRLEESYIRHWSIWKDVAILCRTIPAVMRMDGAL